jgi:hypothetical protein
MLTQSSQAAYPVKNNKHRLHTLLIQSSQAAYTVNITIIGCIRWKRNHRLRTLKRVACSKKVEVTYWAGDTYAARCRCLKGQTFEILTSGFFIKHGPLSRPKVCFLLTRVAEIFKFEYDALVSMTADHERAEAQNGISTKLQKAQNGKSSKQHNLKTAYVIQIFIDA